jgi:asparagine synthase (glutamine-hydrolysing)
MCKFDFFKSKTNDWYQKGNVKVKGYAFDFEDNFLEKEDLADYFNNVTSVKEIKELALLLNGFFLVVIDSVDYVWLIADKLRSIPLFYSNYNEEVWVSDQVSAEDVNFKTFEPISVTEFTYAACTVGNKTLVRDISQISSSEIVSLSKDFKSIERYKYYDHKHSCSLSDNTAELYKKLEAITDNFIERIKRSTSGKALIIPLSGGYDSRYILAALIRNDIKNVVCYTYGDPKSFEISVAKRVAENLGVKLYTVEYTDEMWSSLLCDKNFSLYLDYAFNYSSVPHIQDYLALRELKSKGVLPENGVVIPGFCGDLLGGSYIPKEIIENNQSQLLKGTIEEYIFNKQFKNSNEVIDKDDKCKIINSISATLIKRDNFTIDELISDNEMFLTEHKVSKFVVNSLRVYEFFGFEWRMPLWDDELMDFWYKVPNEFRVNNELYNNYLFDCLFTPLNIGFKKAVPVSRNKLTIGLRKHLPLRLLELTREYYLLLIKVSGKGDVNNFTSISSLLLGDINKNKKCNNVNGALAYYLLDIIQKRKK